MPTQADLRLRNFKWTDLEGLHKLLEDVGIHGHRDWPGTVLGLRAELEYPRVQPESNVTLAQHGDVVVGYAIVEPEKNIGRSVIGLATITGDTETTRQLLEWAVDRAGDEAPLAHLAIRDHESDFANFIEQQNRGRVWKRARKYLKLENASTLSQASAVIPAEFTLRTMLGLDELPELTYLQNIVFKEHFGFSPNTEDEIRSRLLAPGASVDDIVMIHDSSEQLVAYCWTAVSERVVEEVGSKIGRIGMTGVLPAARSQGLGRAIAEAGFNHLLRRDVEAIELDVDSANAPAMRVYSSLGFTTISEVNWWELSL